MAPITLPPHSSVQVTARDETSVLTSGDRATSIRIEVLDEREQVQGTLGGVNLSGSSLSWSANASVKGKGKLDVTDLDQHYLRETAVNWTRARIRPVARVEGIDKDYPLGVWLPSAPSDNLSDGVRRWPVELVDKTGLLDRDVWTGPSGWPRVFVARRGLPVPAILSALVGKVGEVPVFTDPQWQPQVQREMVWDAGTTLLRIVNDLCMAAGAFSIHADMSGRLVVEPYREPRRREVTHKAVGAFQHGPTSLLHPDMTVDRDVYSVPNRFVAVGQASETAPALVGSAVITDPNSPFGKRARGRWITEVETGVEATSQAAINSYAQRKLAMRTAVAGKLNVKHAWLPGVTVNSVLETSNPLVELQALVTVQNIELPLDLTELCSATLREVIGIGEEGDYVDQ